MSWSQDILRERDKVENRTGNVVAFVVVRPEIWAALEEELGGKFELDGALVAVCDDIRQPYEFAGRVDEEG